MKAALKQTTLLTQAQALLGKAIGEHTTQRNTKVNSIINKALKTVKWHLNGCHKRMPLGARA